MARIYSAKRSRGISSKHQQLGCFDGAHSEPAEAIQELEPDGVRHIRDVMVWLTVYLVIAIPVYLELCKPQHGRSYSSIKVFFQ